ncbi:response regulator transcription factor [Streptomyces bohaiensis]|uniref:Response regulator transcription factor n=1 Tax=Streptomyces bohaiensis TaxID=1431344 RepID=A0ABX1CI05_9ACTN|nr:response regulator transcription factor [Streptomyces bohaiensis]NJQ17450.1 response regulator transcription factor [Streptomyces bohaiensis]
MTLRVVVADDRRLVAEALASALRMRGHRVLAAGSPVGRAVELTTGRSPEVCLLGSAEPDGASVLEPLARLVAQAPKLAVVVLGPVPCPRGVAAAFAAGARGYVRHDERIDGVERALARARAGDAAVAPGLLREVFGALLEPGPTPAAEGARLAAQLTPREAHVLLRIVDGDDTRRIADGLGVAPSTARTHIQRLLAKLGTATRLEAVAVAVRTGLLEQLGRPHPPEDGTAAGR